MGLRDVQGAGAGHGIAAIAHVAYSNEKPFIAFRSLSDLAGGDPGENQWATFVQLASGNSAAVVLAFLEALPAT